MKIKNKLKKAFLMLQTLIAILVLNVPIMAEEVDVTEVTSGIDVLVTLVMAFIGGVGAIFLAWGLMDFGTAYAQHDASQQMQGIKKVVAGLIIVAVPTLTAILT